MQAADRMRPAVRESADRSDFDFSNASSMRPQQIHNPGMGIHQVEDSADRSDFDFTNAASQLGASIGSTGTVR